MPRLEGIIAEYLDKKRSIRQYKDDIISLFQIAFKNTTLANQSWFGFPTTKTSLNILFGHIYLVGIFEGTIEIIVDTDIGKEIGLRTRIVKTSQSCGLNLYWISADIEDIKYIVSNEKIWQHYKLASLKVGCLPRTKKVRQDWIKGKYLVSEVFEGLINYVDPQIIEAAFQKQMNLSKKDAKHKRQQRLKRAPTKPIYTLVQTKIFLRNPDVVIEVLERGNGHCEYCNKPAPFNKDSDGQGYLEVHHIIPLAEGGDDTIQNAIALCANCHRQAHYGKNTFDLLSALCRDI